MNFKPTLWKSVSSVVSGILVNYLLIGNVKIVCDCVIGTVCDCPKSSWIEFAFNPVPIMVSLVVIALVYSIWSFVQKK